jgi:hypothetical protein
MVLLGNDLSLQSSLASSVFFLILAIITILETFDLIEQSISSGVNLVLIKQFDGLGRLLHLLVDLLCIVR